MSKQPNPMPKEIGAVKPPAPPSPPFPPERPAGRIFCGICSKEICEIAIDLLSNTTTVCCNICRDKIVELEKKVETLDLPIGER